MCQCHPYQGKRRKSRKPHSTANNGRRRIVRILLARDGDRCFWCNVRFRGDVLPTIEHLLPRSEGGGNGLDNLALACHWCNQKRGVMPVAEFREWLETVSPHRLMP